MSRLAPLVVLLLVPLAARSATPPDFVKIEEKDGKLTAPVTVTKYQAVTKAVAVNENGRTVTKNVTEAVPVTETAYHVLDAAAGEWFTPTGEKLDPKKLGEVLKKGAVLAVSRDGKPLDPEVTKKNKDVVAVLVPKGTAVKDEPKTDLAAEKPFAAEASVGDGAVIIVREAVVMQTAQRQETRALPGGKAEIVTVNVQIPTTKREVVALEPKRTQVLRLDGSVVPPADWADVFKDKTKVLVSPGGKEIPDDLRAAHKDAVAVVVIKAAKK
jgi:hypothetical protein